MSSRPSALALESPRTDALPLIQATALPLLLFSLGHFFVDLYAGSLGVLQPLILRQFGLSFTQAGILGGVLSFSSSVTQPLYGYLSDRFHSRLFTVLAPAVAGIFISTLGWASGFPMLLVMVFLAGAGMASFHPQAASNATRGIRQNRARGMAIFISSGTLGLAFGPTYFSLITSRWGLAGAYGAAIPGIFVTLLLLIFLRPFHRDTAVTSRFSLQPLRAVWKPMTILYILVFLRSVVQITFTQFLPLYLQTARGYSLPKASYSLSLYLVSGALGGIAGGNLADRFGGKRVILVSMLGAVPLLAVFVFTTGFLSTIGMFLGGLVLLFTIPVNLIMAQQLAPTQTATISALMMGFAWGMAGIVFIPLTGWVADHYSMQTAFTALIAFPLVGFLLALKLPE